MIDDYKYMRLFIYVLIYDCILYFYGLLISFVFGGSGFIDIDTYLYGIPLWYTFMVYLLRMILKV